MLNSLLFQVVKWYEIPTITEWITAASALFGTMAALYVLTQNSRTIKTAKNILQLTVVPSANVEYPDSSNNNSFVFQNTSSIALSNIEVYKAWYFVSRTNPPLIERRHQSSALRTEAKLENLEKIYIPVQHIMHVDPTLLDIQIEGNMYYSVIFVFHREIDNKRFVKVEPFGGGFLDDGTPIVVPSFPSPNSASAEEGQNTC